MTPSSETPVHNGPVRGLSRWMFLAAGLTLVAIGVLGLALPLLPSTIFFILAAAAFARSSPRLEQWLISHAHFGPAVRAWRQSGAIPFRGKVAALLGMALGYGLFIFGASPAWHWLVLAGALLAGCAAFILTRPTVPSDHN